ncbi:MAG: hypothetical protein KatS3mg087_0299 [Patescibacteria group bacterium]|nr:MAG: hypothetical protein KatS3mg087_0299 [Patescibacteria group bacterium]
MTKPERQRPKVPTALVRKHDQEYINRGVGGNLTLADAARVSGIPAQKFRKLADDLGVLRPPDQPGGNLRFSRRDIATVKAHAESTPKKKS